MTSSQPINQRGHAGGLFAAQRSANDVVQSFHKSAGQRGCAQTGPSSAGLRSPARLAALLTLGLAHVLSAALFGGNAIHRGL